MPDALLGVMRDPMARTILAVLAISVTITLFLWRRKGLTYSVIPTQIFSVHDAVKGRVQILLDGVPAADLFLFMITVKNSGREPISEGDFVRPICFTWDTTVRVLSAEVVRVTPPQLQPVVAANDNQLLLSPLLLNAKDSFTVKALVDQGGAPLIDGRITGVKRLRLVVDNPTDKWFVRGMAALVALLLFLLTGRYFDLWTPDGPFERRLVFSVLVVLLVGASYKLVVIAKELARMVQNWRKGKT